MINRVLVSGYLASAITLHKHPRKEYRFRLYISGKKVGMGMRVVILLLFMLVTRGYCRTFLVSLSVEILCF